MKRFEYFTLTIATSDNSGTIYYDDGEYDYNTNYNEIMRDLGYQGWELVSVVTLIESYKPWFVNTSMTYTGGMEYYFKRELTDELIEEKKKEKEKRTKIAEEIEKFTYNEDELIEIYIADGYFLTFQHNDKIIFEKGGNEVQFNYNKSSDKWVKN